MRIAGTLLAGLVVALILFTDLTAAWIGSLEGAEAAGLMRSVREALLLLLAAGGAVAALASGLLRARDLFGLVYGMLVAVYAAAYLFEGYGASGGLASMGLLLLPLIFVYGGYLLAIMGVNRSHLAMMIVIAAFASMAFGLWEIKRTEFWTDTIMFPDYLRDVKGVVLGFEPTTGLPWNFFRSDVDDRRAAGLLASPLAQGPVVVIAAILCLIMLRAHPAWRVLLAGALLYGAVQSETRAAILVFLLFILLASFLFGTKRILASSYALILWGVGIFFFRHQIQSALDLTDGSTSGHVAGLLMHLQDLNKVLLLGAGLGTQGAIAGQEGRILIGGGESALFSIIYQVGGIGGILFCLFYAAVLLELLGSGVIEADKENEKHRKEHAMIAMMGLAMAANLLISEYLLTISGAGLLWLLLGYFQASARQARRKAETGL
jgi:hypothetical protein